MGITRYESAEQTIPREVESDAVEALVGLLASEIQANLKLHVESRGSRGATRFEFDGVVVEYEMRTSGRITLEQRAYANVHGGPRFQVGNNCRDGARFIVHHRIGTGALIVVRHEDE